MQRLVLTALVIGTVLCGAAGALAETTEEAARAFASGQALLAKADFPAALGAFRSAARADDGNQTYAQEYAMLRQVMRMRSDCAAEKDAERWLNLAAPLRTFYYDHSLYSEALALDQQRQRRAPCSESAVQLAETQLALHMDSDAAETLGALPENQVTPRARVLSGLALARLGRLDEAGPLADAPPPPDAGPRFFYDLARLEALAGDPKGAIEALTRSFELTPPSRLEALKAEVAKSAEFSTLAGGPAFAGALKTKSKIAESGCSKGAGCGKCPKRGGCGSKAAKDHKKTP